MKRTKRLPPYDAEGRTNFPARNVPGVYLIYRNGKPTPFSTGGHELRYVGYGGRDVYKALYRHFQVWNDRQSEAGERGPRTVYRLRSGYSVRVIYCNTARQARELEKALILKHRPSDNPDKLELYELTDTGKELASEALSAPFVENIEAPF